MARQAFFCHLVAALHHQAPNRRQQLGRQQGHIVDHRLVLVTRLVIEIPVAQETTYRRVMVRQVVKTVEVAAQSLLQHPQHQNLPQVHSRTPDCAVGLRQNMLVEQRKQPRAQRLVAPYVLKPLQHRRDVVPRLRVVRWSRSFGPFEGLVKVYSGCKTTPSSSVWYLIIDDDELWESCGLMSESAKRGGEPREGVRGRGRKRRGDWRTKHLRACLLCGRVWRPGRRRTCPVCHVDRSICLTCDQVAVEDRARRCATDEALRRLVKACAGDWERARRALDAAGGDVPRALARAERAGSAKRVSGRDGRRCSGE